MGGQNLTSLGKAEISLVFLLTMKQFYLQVPQDIPR